MGLLAQAAETSTSPLYYLGATLVAVTLLVGFSLVGFSRWTRSC